MVLYKSNGTQCAFLFITRTKSKNIQKTKMISTSRKVVFAILVCFVSVLSAAPVTETACRAINLGQYFSKAGAKITQVAQYYNTTTVVESLDSSNKTVFETVVTPTYFTVSGGITILDACTFQLDNVTITSVAPDTVWYGKVSSDYTVGQQISGSIVPMNDTTTSYTLMNGVTFESIDTLIMFSRVDQLQLAYVTFPRKVADASAGVDTSTSGVASGSQNGTASTQGSQGSGSFRSNSPSSSVTLVFIILSLLYSML